MTKLEALRELLEKVEAGDRPLREAGDSDFENAALILKAFDGSMDAALSLFGAVLPGYGFLIGMKNSCVSLPDDPKGIRQGGFIGSNDNPSRALLIAILKALISLEEGK